MVNSKAKGGDFERVVCKALSRWVSDGEQEDCFWRSAMSGGRATVSQKKGGKTLARQAGDISAVSPEGHALTDQFYIECKHVKSLDLEGFFLKGTGALTGFWRTAHREAANHKRRPMIIARQNLLPTILVVEGNLPVRRLGFGGIAVRMGFTQCHVYLFDDVLKVPFSKVLPFLIDGGV